MKIVSGPRRPPMILLGNARSGTTMLQRLFECHPDVVAFVEPRTIWTYPDPLREHDCFVSDDASPQVIRFIRERFAQFEEQNDGRRIVEKTPSNMLRIPYIRKVFPESRFVYIVRDPFASIASALKMWDQPVRSRVVRRRLSQIPLSQLHVWGYRYFRTHLLDPLLGKRTRKLWGVRYPGIQDDLRRESRMVVAARQWANCVDFGEKDLAGLDSQFVYRLRYEDFVTNPARYYEEAMGHFGLEVSSELRDKIVTLVDPGRQEKWKDLPLSDLVSCLSILKHGMELHGYALPEQIVAEGDKLAITKSTG